MSYISNCYKITSTISSKAKNTIKIFALGLICTSLTNSYATADDTQKFAVVETRKVIEESVAHQGILSQVQKKNEEYRDGIQKLEANLKKKYQDLETKKNALSQEALDKRNEEMGKEVAELQKKSYGQHAALEDAYRNATQQLLDKAGEIIKRQAAEKGYKIVVEKAATAYSEPSLEITNIVLEGLNQSTPSVQVDFKTDESNSNEKTQSNTEVKKEKTSTEKK
jgi:outer membrane protein